MGTEPKSLVLWVLVSGEAESQKTMMSSNRAVRGLSRMLWERGRRAGVGSLCSGRDGTSET